MDRRHDIGFRIPRPDLSVALGTPNACNDCHKDQSAAWAAHAVDGWYGRVRKGFQDFAPALAAVRAERPDGARLLRRLVANGSQPAIARATACAALAPYLTDSIAAELEGALRDPDPLVRLGALRGLDGLPVEQRWAFAGALLGDSIRAVRLEATSFLAEVPASDLAPEARAAMDRAMAEYIAAQEVNADRPDAHLNLGLMYAQRGDPSRAEAEYRSALRLDRRFVPGYVNLADLYRSEGRDADGERVLREALAVAPDDASVHHSLGLLLVREKRLPEALTWLERAARERPEVARYGYVYGVALSSAGRADEALRTLEAAYRRHPADRSILEALVGVARDVGDAHRARAYAEKLRSL